ncbi:MAG: amidohydrolase [Terriglobia bacterium]
MKIDAHQHFWIFNAKEYGWIGPGMEILKRDYLPEDLAPLLEPEGIGGTVAVQARQCLEESRWLLKLADENTFIKGVVGWVDLCSSRVEEQLALLAQHRRFRGIRHIVHDEPDDRFMLREDFMRGIGFLAKYKLTYDLLLFPRHLTVAREFVSRFPDQPFVVDHLAKPRIRAHEFDSWAGDIRRLAGFPNVFCKISGLVTEADWKSWKPGDFTPYLDTVLECFGTKRLMVGSDWPVCALAGEYAAVLRIPKDYVNGLSADEQQAVCGDNAARFYALPD